MSPGRIDLSQALDWGPARGCHGDWIDAGSIAPPEGGAGLGPVFAENQPDGIFYSGTYKELRRRFGKAVAETAGTGAALELALLQPRRIDHVVLQVEIAQGERVRQYTVEGLTRGENNWQELAAGQSIGQTSSVVGRAPNAPLPAAAADGREQIVPSGLLA